MLLATPPQAQHYQSLPRLVRAPGVLPLQVQTATQATGTATPSSAASPRARPLRHIPAATITGVVPTAVYNTRSPQRLTTTFSPQRLTTTLTTTFPQVLLLPTDGWMLIKRTTSSVLGSVTLAEPEKTFHCPFCLENVRVDERFTFAACDDESHGVCRECIGRYIRRLVTDGRVTRIECHQCGASASSVEVLQLTDAATFRKYERFQQMQQDHTVRECPKCSTLCKPETDEDDNPVAEMECHECGAEFCFYHSNAHVGQPCAEYRKRMAREDAMSEQGVLRNTKACPECGVRTEKTGGCNHMTCQRCGSDWCWVCGMKLDDVTAHYYFGGPFACGQFEDFDPGSPLTFCLRCMTLPLQVVSVVLFVLLSLTMVVWFPVAFLLLVPCNFNIFTCTMQPSALRCVLLCAVVLTYIPFVIFQVVWTLCAALIWLLLRPFGAERRHLVYLARAPVIANLPVLICFQVLVDYFRSPEDDFEPIEAGATDGLLQRRGVDLEAASDGTSEPEASSLDDTETD